MLKYVDLITSSKSEDAEQIIDSCIEQDFSEDFSDHIYNVYKCFMQGINRQSSTE